MFKKILVCALCIGLLSSCNDKGNENTKNTDSVSTTNVTKEEKEEKQVVAEEEKEKEEEKEVDDLEEEKINKEYERFRYLYGQKALDEGFISESFDGKEYYYIKHHPTELLYLIQRQYDMSLSYDEYKNVVTYNHSFDLIEENPFFLLDMEESNKYIDSYNSIMINEMSEDSDAIMPIMKIEGIFIGNRPVLGNDSDYSLYTLGLVPIGDTEDGYLINVLLNGDYLNYTRQFGNGEAYTSLWALPLGIFETKTEDGEDYRVYEFIATETMQHTAYKYFNAEWFLK